jgi:hypothetical protein
MVHGSAMYTPYRVRRAAKERLSEKRRRLEMSAEERRSRAVLVAADSGHFESASSFDYDERDDDDEEEEEGDPDDWEFDFESESGLSLHSSPAHHDSFSTASNDNNHTSTAGSSTGNCGLELLMEAGGGASKQHRPSIVGSITLDLDQDQDLESGGRGEGIDRDRDSYMGSDRDSDGYRDSYGHRDRDRDVITAEKRSGTLGISGERDESGIPIPIDHLQVGDVDESDFNPHHTAGEGYPSSSSSRHKGDMSATKEAAVEKDNPSRDRMYSEESDDGNKIIYVFEGKLNNDNHDNNDKNDLINVNMNGPERLRRTRFAPSLTTSDSPNSANSPYSAYESPFPAPLITRSMDSQRASKTGLFSGIWHLFSAADEEEQGIMGSRRLDNFAATDSPTFRGILYLHI